MGCFENPSLRKSSVLKEVKKMVKAGYKNEWGERVTLDYTSGHRKRRGKKDGVTTVARRLELKDLI